MNYEEVKKLNPPDFKRYCGVHIETFNDMVKIVKAEKILQKKPGRKSKLSIEDQILMTLAYLREYRPFFHLAIDWGINQSNVCRIVNKIEKILISSGLFSLLGKRKLIP
ncbi:MAG: transposase family protein, partial [Dolichospermum sp.]